MTYWEKKYEKSNNYLVAAPVAVAESELIKEQKSTISETRAHGGCLGSQRR